MRKLKTLALTLALLAAGPLAASAGSLTAQLAGFAGGNENGAGLAVLAIDGAQISTTILTNGVDDPTVAHVHKVSDGGIFIDLNVSFTGATGAGATTADAADIAALMASPGAYFVQVHSSAYPAGAIKGVLTGGAGGGATELYFPVLAAITGQGGTRWNSDVRLVNRSGGAASVSLEYYAEGASGNASPTATAGPFPINPGAELMLDDVVNAQLGIADGKGGVKVTSDQPLSGASRVYNDQRSKGNGTLGQQVPAMTMAQALSAGMVPMLANVPQSSGAGFRANIGWFNPNGGSVTITFTFFAADGALLGTATRTIGGHGLVQENASSLLGALANTGDFYLTFTASGGAVFVYGTLVDNVSGDSIYVPAMGQ